MMRFFYGTVGRWDSYQQRNSLIDNGSNKQVRSEKLRKAETFVC